MAVTLRQDMLAALRSVLPAEPGIAVIHSSFARLVPPEGFSPWDALYAIGVLAQEGWTVALPAFTFSFCGSGTYHWRDSRSEVGLFADWLLEHFPDAVRTPHPIYSFVVIGPRAAEIAACRNSTTFGDDSTFGLFEREDAQMVMLGCGWEFCTQTHRYEEVVQVPYRFYKTFSGSADFGQGDRSTQARMLVRDLTIDAINDLSVVVDPLRRQDAIRSAPLFRGEVEAVGTLALAETAMRMLDGNPYALLSDAPRVAAAVAARDEALSQPPVKLAVLGSSNVHRLEEEWAAQLQALVPERRIASYALPYGQMQTEILAPDSALNAFGANLRVFCDRLDDLAVDDDEEATLAAVGRYADLVRRAHESGGWTIVHRFAALSANGVSDGARQAARLVEACNGLLDESLVALPQLTWVDLAAEAAAHEDAVEDPRLWFIGRFAFSDSFSRRLGRRWAGLALAAIGKAARVVVVDLDNTCWGGVLGEDGLEGIRIGGDHPGNAFAVFQRQLKQLTHRGIALAVASKNDDDLALRALDELPSQVLRSGDFIERRINWKPKWQNIQDIADALNLGLGSVLFIDDNPVEREAVRANLPAVKVLDLPTDPALYARAVADCPYLAATTVTAEDAKRNESFKARKALQQQARGAASLEDFYESLGMRLHLMPLDTGNAQRAAQLCNKTNQFNTTTRRYDLGDLQTLRDEGADVVVIGLEDRQSTLENIGLVILKPVGPGIGEIDLYLLSCRVLGRGLEIAVAKWAATRAARRGWTELRGVIIETERNTPVRSVFADSGFQQVGPGAWSISPSQTTDIPRWIELVDRVEAEKMLS